MKDNKFLPSTKVISEGIPEIRLFPKFHLNNPGSRSWDQYLFWFKPYRPSVNEIQVFLNLNLNIQKFNVKVMGNSQNSRSNSGASIASTHIHSFRTRPTQLWDTAILNFDFENPSSRSSSKLKATNWNRDHVHSHFWNITISEFDLEIQGQCHGWGKRLRSHNWNNINSIFLFVSRQLAQLFLRYDQ